MSNDIISTQSERALAALRGAKFLAQLETAGNQGYIFATNRLRENIGGSHLLGLSCGQWVDQAAATRGATVVFSTSGRAFLAADERETLEQVIGDVTGRALREAPGLTITGSVTEWPPHVTEPSISTQLGEAMRILSDSNERIAGQYPAVLTRFHRLPPVAQCAVSTLPAEFTRTIAGSQEFVSAPSHAKHSAGVTAWRKRSGDYITQLMSFPGDQPTKVDVAGKRLAFAQSIDTLEEFFGRDADQPSSASQDIGWLAVVHIDGSGVGKTFIEMARHAASKAQSSGQDDLGLHLKAYFTLSNGLDAASNRALVAALAEVIQEDGKIPVVPLIAGGDDVTIICLGRDALRFTATYLTTFEESTAPVAADIRAILGNDAAPERFTASAGVAIIKPHYPFHLANHLAESLIGAAKSKVKRVVADGDVIPSSYDVHVLSDSSAIALEEIRDRRRSTNGMHLWGGPYVIGAVPSSSGLRSHQWLEQALSALSTRLKSDTDSRTSRSGLNRVKAALFTSLAAAEQAEKELPSNGLPSSVKDPDQDRLATTIEVDGRKERSSAFVDLLDLLDIHQVSASSQSAAKEKR